MIKSQKRKRRVVYLCPSPEHAHDLLLSLFASQMCSSDDKTEETEKNMRREAEALRARA